MLQYTRPLGGVSSVLEETPLNFLVFVCGENCATQMTEGGRESHITYINSCCSQILI